MVACESDMSYFCTMESDSPSWLRSLGDAVERIQHIFFSIRLSLLACERIAGSDVRRFQSDHILASNAVDAAVQHGLDAIALTDFAADVAGDAVVWAAAHKLQRLSDLLIREDIQIRRLPEIDRQRFLKRAIEDRIGCGVDEIGNQDRIFFRQRVSALKKDKADAGSHTATITAGINHSGSLRPPQQVERIAALEE